MRFKREENDLMWEAFIKPYDNRYSTTPVEPTDADYVDSEYPDNEWDDDMDDEGEEGEVMLEIEPEGELEISDGEGDTEGIDEVLLSDLKKLAEYSQKLLDVHCKCNLETWMIAKLVKASDYVSDVWHRLDAKADFANDGYEQSDNLSLENYEPNPPFRKLGVPSREPHFSQTLTDPFTEYYTDGSLEFYNDPEYKSKLKKMVMGFKQNPSPEVKEELLKHCMGLRNQLDKVADRYGNPLTMKIEKMINTIKRIVKNA